MLHVGDTIGDYRVLSFLNEGGMASLYLGRHGEAPPDAPPVAIKVIHEHLSQDWQFARMFVDEALISVRLRHPNVIRVDELGEHEGLYYLVMEYVNGCSVAELLRAMGKRGRRMRPEIAVWIASQVAAGLHAAHEMVGHDGQQLGIVHRDVSPQNVLLGVDGSVKLLDFGIAKARGRAERTEAGVIKGKIRYMAPEQAMGGELDRRVDVYALGVVLWETLTMRRFIEGKNEIEIVRRVRDPDTVPPSFRVDGIDPAIDDAVMAALEVQPERRPRTAAELRRLLQGAVPRGRVGPAHVAELLRVFMGDEIAEAAMALPPEVGAPMAEHARHVRPLPGEDAGPGAGPGSDERTRTLTLETEPVALGEDLPRTQAPSGAASARGAGWPEQATRAAIPSRVGRDSPPAALDRLDTRPDVELIEDEDEEPTLASQGAELREFLERIGAAEEEGGRLERPAPKSSPAALGWPGEPAGAAPGSARAPRTDRPRAAPSAAAVVSAAAPATGAGSGPSATSGVSAASGISATPAVSVASGASAACSLQAPPPRAPPATSPMASPAASPTARWALVILGVTLVAFCLGAGLAVAVVKLVS